MWAAGKRWVEGDSSYKQIRKAFRRRRGRRPLRRLCRGSHLRDRGAEQMSNDVAQTDNADQYVAVQHGQESHLMFIHQAQRRFYTVVNCTADERPMQK